MKRLITVVVALILLLSVGCDSDKTNMVANKKLPMFMEEVETHKETVNFWLPPPGRYLREDVVNKIEELTSRFINIDLRFNKLYGSTARQILEDHTYNTLGSFDAMVVEGDISPLIERDYVMDLTEIFKKYAPNYFNQLSFDDLARVTYDGKIMAIPNHMKGSKRMCAVIRVDLLSELNIESLRDFDEYEEFMQRVESKHPEFFSVTTTMPQEIFLHSMGYAPFMNGIVYKWDDPDMKLIPFENTQDFRSALIIQNRWAKLGYIPESYAFKEITQPYIVNTTWLLKAAQTKNLVSFIAEWDSALIHTRMLNIGEFTYKIFPLELNKAAPETDMDGMVTIIGKNSKNAERILKLIDWIHSSQENYDIFMYGLEGIDYTLVGDQVKLQNQTSDIQYNWEGCEAFRNINYERSFVTDRLSNPTGYELGNDPGLRLLPTEGFTLKHNGILDGYYVPENNETVGATYERYNLLGMALDNTSVADMQPEKVLSIDEAIRQIRHNQEIRNINGVVKEMQRQLDDWRELRKR